MIETDRGDLHRGRLLFCGVPERRSRQALDAVQEGPFTPSASHGRCPPCLFGRFCVLAT